jgi:hypothetical protein
MSIASCAWAISSIASALPFDLKALAVTVVARTAIQRARPTETEEPMII